MEGDPFRQRILQSLGWVGRISLVGGYLVVNQASKDKQVKSNRYIN